MNVYTESVAHIVTDLGGIANKQFSDVLDDEGNQYVDLVMEGGGVLGIALLGYFYILERMGLRFLSIGGTSAGSITALLLAALGEPAEAKAERLTNMLVQLDMASFVDGDDDARDFVDALLAREKPIKLAWKGWQVIDNLQDDLGLNPGNEFKRWVTEKLDSMNVSTTAQLGARMAITPKGLRNRITGEKIQLKATDNSLCLIAADISTETRVMFPRMAKLYWADPDAVHPAEYCRASMSIPLFFTPYTVADMPNGDAAKALWRELAGFNDHDLSGEEWLPKKCVFVDGGVMSNFPIDVFHKREKRPSRPTFGVKLQWDERSHQIDGPIKLALQVFNSARHILDYEFIKNNSDYRHLVEFIDTKDQDWLEFSLSDDAKRELFLRGALAAQRFLLKFDWDAYKKLREGIAAAYLQSLKIEAGKPAQ